jgi:vibriolysin
LTNRLLKTFCAAWVGVSMAACGAVDGQGEADELGSTSDKAGQGEVHAALSALGGARVLGSQEDGTPGFISGDFGQAAPAALVARGSHLDAADALARVAPAFRLNATDLVFKRETVDERGHRHLRFTQTKNGLKVIGGELILHIDETGRVYAANASGRDGERGSAQPRISAEAAGKAALRSTAASGLAIEGTPGLVYVRNGAGKLRLSYEAMVTGTRADGLPVRDRVYVDAQSGEELLRSPEIHEALNRRVHHGNNTTSLPGTLRRSEGGAATADVHIDENYDHLGTTYNCYKTLFNRDSYNNAGAALTSTVHHSTNYVNAFWNGTQMVYGDGNGVDSGMLGRDLDVTVHELTHAVTDSESDLVYSNESGALNEAMSDIFAAVCESWTRTPSFTIDPDVWKIGEDIWTPGTAGDALRYMANPTQDGSSKDYYPTRYTGTSDNGGVHWNSGIANLAFQLLAQGGTHPRGVTTTVVPGIGVELAARIFYKANTDIFTSSTNFAGAKTGTEQAAVQLGYDANIQAAVTKAWEAVGVGIVVPPPPTVTLTDGVAVTSISDSAGGKRYYKLTVPTGQATLKFNTSGGTGDVDMYVRRGAAPDEATYDCRPYASGNTEECAFTNPVAGDYYVMLNGYSTYSGVSLVGDFAAGSTGGGTPTTDTKTGSVSAGQNVNFPAYSVVAGTKFKVVMTGTGDPDLYVRFGAAPTTSTYTCRPYLSGASETCDLTVPAGQTSAYVMVRGYTSGTYNLTINYTKP